jgi:CBS domain-containing protein
LRHIKDNEAKTKGAAVPRPTSVVTATGKTTLGEAISLLEEHCIHRLYMLDSTTGKLAGVVTLKTILERIIDSPTE